MHWHIAWEQWVVGLLHHAATPLGGNGEWDSFGALPHYWGAVGSGTIVPHC